MRLFFALVFVIALVVLVAQLRADPQPSGPAIEQVRTGAAVIVGTGFPEPVSTVFILGGASALALWRLARRFDVV